jgi:hypothetical protein
MPAHSRFVAVAATALMALVAGPTGVHAAVGRVISSVVASGQPIAVYWDTDTVTSARSLTVQVRLLCVCVCVCARVCVCMRRAG